MTYKCRLCGGTIDFSQGDSAGKCGICGVFQPLPVIDSERRANLYDRAGHFRRNNEFDRAEVIYRQLTEENRSDPEAYWSLVLCRYGIEFVENPSNGRRVVTVNRTRQVSVTNDENYLNALRYSDDVQRVLYQAEANEIDKTLKQILEVSEKAEHFDVFICYRETDRYGRRLQDSILAEDIYRKLSDSGLKVFYARAVLSDKSGREYEPYIYSALNSSKVMIVLGTIPENLNYVWVKNEWSRYLELIRNGEAKVIIPVYRDLNPYDLPDEFSDLKALDMSRPEFLNELAARVSKQVSLKKSISYSDNPAVYVNKQPDKNITENKPVCRISEPVKNAQKADALIKMSSELYIPEEQTENVSVPGEGTAEADEQETAQIKARRLKVIIIMLILIILELIILGSIAGSKAYRKYVAKTDEEKKTADNAAVSSHDVSYDTDSENQMSYYSDTDNTDNEVYYEIEYSSVLSNAEDVIEQGMYEEAVSILSSIQGYKPAMDRLKEMSELLYSEYSRQIGGIHVVSVENEKIKKVIYGNYVWDVLEQKDSLLYVISDTIIDRKAFNETEKNYRWEYSTIRNYLNNDFYNKFTDEEKESIKMVTLRNSSLDFDGNDTDDYIFLISEDDVYIYLYPEVASREYFGTSQWWIRTPVYNSDEVWTISDYSLDRQDVQSKSGIRPAMYLTY